MIAPLVPTLCVGTHFFDATSFPRSAWERSLDALRPILSREGEAELMRIRWCHCFSTTFSKVSEGETADRSHQSLLFLETPRGSFLTDGETIRGNAKRRSIPNRQKTRPFFDSLYHVMVLLY